MADVSFIFLLLIASSAFILEKGHAKKYSEAESPLECIPPVTYDDTHTACCTVLDQYQIEEDDDDSRIKNICVILTYAGDHLTAMEYIKFHGLVLNITVDSVSTSCATIPNSAEQEACIIFTVYNSTETCFHLNVTNNSQSVTRNSFTSSVCLDLPTLNVTRSGGMSRRAGFFGSVFSFFTDLLDPLGLFTPPKNSTAGKSQETGATTSGLPSVGVGSRVPTIGNGGSGSSTTNGTATSTGGTGTASNSTALNTTRVTGTASNSTGGTG